MEKQESLSFIEVCLRLVNNNLKHFKLCALMTLIPTVIAFVLVMWVIDPTYRATAIVTPPADNSKSMGGGISNFLSSGKGGSGNGLASLFNLNGGNEDADVVWTIFNSWELHSQVIEEFDLARHYEFTGKYQADLLKKFRKNFEIENTDENMFEITVEDKDFRVAAQIIAFMLDKADSAYNMFKTSQARQSRLYIQSRLDSCEKSLDTLLRKFAKFQTDNNFYDPEIQLESTIKYLSDLQAKREELSMEMAYEKDDRGEQSKRYEQLAKRYKGINTALNGTLHGKNDQMGIVSLKKSPKLNAEYLQFESEIKVQSALYQMLRVQYEELQMEEAKMLTNLHVLEPPWENDKKVAPARGLILIFTFALFFIFATIISNVLAYLKSEESKGSDVANEWIALKNRLHLRKG